MRKMFSENQIKNIVNQGIESGEIKAGVNLKKVVNNFTPEEIVYSYYPFSVGKLYLFEVLSANNSNIAFIALCQDEYTETYEFLMSAIVYALDGSATFVCKITIGTSGLTFANDDGSITFNTEDLINIYEL